MRIYTHTHTHTLHSPHPGMPQNLDPFQINYTDGQQVLAQATDNESPNQKNVVYLRSSKQPQKSDSPSSAKSDPSSNAKQLSDEASDEWWPKNGCFPSLDVLRKHSDEVKPLDFTLIYCSQVCWISIPLIHS